jgi:hypothetical protein
MPDKARVKRVPGGPGEYQIAGAGRNPRAENGARHVEGLYQPFCRASPAAKIR